MECRILYSEVYPSLEFPARHVAAATPSGTFQSDVHGTLGSALYTVGHFNARNAIKK